MTCGEDRTHVDIRVTADTLEKLREHCNRRAGTDVINTNLGANAYVLCAINYFLEDAEKNKNRRSSKTK